MSAMGKQIISAGAATCGAFLEMIVMASQLREDSRDASSTASQMQSEATLADGTAQRTSLEQEAHTRGNMAMQSFFDAGSQLGGEAVGWATEKGLNSYSSSANKARANVDALQKWETYLDEGTPAHLKVSMKPAEVKPTVALTPEQVGVIDTSVLSKQNGEVMTPKEYFATNKENKAIFDQGITSRDEAVTKFKKELRRQLKDARSESENISSGYQRIGTRIRDCSRSVGTGARGYYDLQSQQLQMDEAIQKQVEANMRYGSEVSASTVRIAQGTADNQTSLIQAIQQAESGMFEANRA
jgi:hypothetical protein